MQLLLTLYSELMELRRTLRNVGGNLNDVARHVNSTGELHVATASAQALVVRVVERVDETVGQVLAATAVARDELPRARR